MKPSRSTIKSIIGTVPGVDGIVDDIIALWEKSTELFSVKILEDSSLVDVGPISKLKMADYISKAAVLLHIKDNRSFRRRTPDVRREHKQDEDRREGEERRE